MIELRWLKKKDHGSMLANHYPEGKTVLQLRQMTWIQGGGWLIPVVPIEWTEWADIPVVEEE